MSSRGIPSAATMPNHDHRGEQDQDPDPAIEREARQGLLDGGACRSFIRRLTQSHRGPNQPATSFEHQTLA